MRLPAARNWLFGLNATDCTGGVCGKERTSSPVCVSKILTEGSCSAAGSYLYPPQIYWPVTEAITRPFGERSLCHDQKLCAFTLRVTSRFARSCQSRTPSYPAEMRVLPSGNKWTLEA